MNAYIRPAAGEADADSVYPCAECGLPLPIRICPEHDDAESVVCASCGACYRGIVDKSNDELRLNIKVEEG